MTNTNRENMEKEQNVSTEDENSAFEDVTETEVSDESQTSEEETSVENEIALMKDQLLRAMAEAENVRRRAARDKEDALKYSVSNFARDILAVSDNLRRAIEAIPDKEISESIKAFVEGVEMTERELHNIMEKYGIKKIMPEIGEKFDAAFHQAMFEVPTAEHEPGKVMNVMQPGYKIHDRLLRPAMVGVSKKA